MKNNWKIKNYSLLFSLILLFLMMIPNNLYNYKNNETNGTEDNNNIILETSGHWYLTGAAISIDETIPTSNWSYTEANYDWCSGNGTLNNPYLIENVTVNGLGVGTCIYISNSKNSYFTIRNCTVYDSSNIAGNAGIKITNVNNGTLVNNTCSLSRIGINLSSNSDNNTIIENILLDNGVFGLVLEGNCDENKISNNTIISNGQYGILLSVKSNGNNITNNIIKHNGWGFDTSSNSGINIYASDDNIVSNNDITNNNRNGIYVSNPWCYDNVIINNIISENKIGIQMSNNVNRTLITDNLIKDNINYGILIADPVQLRYDIYLNWFIDNGIQVYDNGLGQDNEYDNGTIGNFWSDYPGVDADDNGTGDTPYLIGGDSGGNQDNYPIWYDSPNIEIDSPQPSEIFETTAPTFNVTITDPNLEAMWYTLNNEMQKVPFSTNESINQTLWDSLFDGQHVITFYANDSIGNENSSSVTVFRDTGAPTININSPNLNDVFASTPPAFNVTITDFLLNTTWYTIGGNLTEFIFTSNGSLDATVWNNALEGLINITFYANDTLGNTNSASVSVYKDTHMPIISIITPENGDTFNATAPTFIVWFYDANPVGMWYTINNSLTEYTFTVNGSINQAAWNALPEGDLMLRFYFEDIAGRVASDFVGIYKKLPTPDGNGGNGGNGGTEEPAIYGYSLILLITTIWIISTVIIVFLKRNIKKN